MELWLKYKGVDDVIKCLSNIMIKISIFMTLQNWGIAANVDDNLEGGVPYSLFLSHHAIVHRQI